MEIYDSDFHGMHSDERHLPGVSRPIHIADNSWIGVGETLLKGASIGRNSIVGAASVVTGNVGKNIIVAGVPAKEIGTL